MSRSAGTNVDINNTQQQNNIDEQETLKETTTICNGEVTNKQMVANLEMEPKKYGPDVETKAVDAASDLSDNGSLLEGFESDIAGKATSSITLRGVSGSDRDVELKVKETPQEKPAVKSWIAKELGIEATPIKKRKHNVVLDEKCPNERNDCPIPSSSNLVNVYADQPKAITTNTPLTHDKVWDTPHAAAQPPKCSTESTSEFPLSSPSDIPIDSERMPVRRQPLLKNTLPADSFERGLSNIAQNSRWSLEEKIESWQCSSELSDVEDVNDFDEVFRQYEEKRKYERKMKTKCNAISAAAGSTSQHNTVFKDLRRHMTTAPKAVTDTGPCDFSQFRMRMIKQLYSPPQQNWRLPSDNAAHTNLDKPKARIAAHFATQRQLLAAAEAETKVRKEQMQKMERAQHSTTPPATSSSGSDKKYYANVGQKRISTHLRSTEKAAQYSTTSDDTQEMAKRTRTDEDPSTSGAAKRLRQTQQRQELPAKPTNRNTCVTPETSQDSAAKTPPPAILAPPPQPLSTQAAQPKISIEVLSPPRGLIQMRLDFVEEKKDLQLKKKTTELFKTPTPVNSSSLQQDQHQEPIIIEQDQKLIENPVVHENVPPHSPSLMTPMTISIASINVVDPLVNPEDIADEGSPPDGTEFHEQHEFCNYLGLTGMSTVNAFANAVAELANCNLTRRSLRVRRLQQQEKQEKEKERNSRQSEGQTEFIGKERQQGGRDSAPALLCQEDAQGTSNTPRTTPTLVALSGDNDDQNTTGSGEENNSRLQNASETSHNLQRSSVTSQKLIKSMLDAKKKEPEIKIVCQIDSTDKGVMEQKSKVTDRPLENISRRLRANGQGQQRPVSSTPPLLGAMFEKTSKNVSPTQGTPTVTAIEKKTSPKPTNNRFSSPLPAAALNSKHLSQKNVTPSIACLQDKSYTQELQQVQNKFQKFLQDSRRSKPSIYIVQSLGSIHATVQPPQPKSPTKPNEISSSVMRNKKVQQSNNKVATNSQAPPPIAPEVSVASVKTALRSSGLSTKSPPAPVPSQNGPHNSVAISHSKGIYQMETFPTIVSKPQAPRRSSSPPKQRPGRSVSPPKKKLKTQRNTRQSTVTPDIMDDKVLHGPANIDLDNTKGTTTRRRGSASGKTSVGSAKKKIRLRKLLTRNTLLPSKRQLRSSRKTTIFVTNLKCMLKRKMKNRPVKKVDKSIGTSDPQLSPFKFDVLYGTQEMSSYLGEAQMKNAVNENTSKLKLSGNATEKQITNRQEQIKSSTEAADVKDAKSLHKEVIETKSFRASILEPIKNRKKRKSGLSVSKDPPENVKVTITKIDRRTPEPKILQTPPKTPPVKELSPTKPVPSIKTNTSNSNNNSKSTHNEAVTFTTDQIMNGIHLKTLGRAPAAGRQLRRKLVRQTGGGSTACSSVGGSCESKTSERPLRSSRVYGSQRSQPDSTNNNLTKPLPKVETKDIGVQALNLGTPNTIHYLTKPMRPWQNPLKRDYGRVLYIYFEMDVLIVVQEFVVSFWRYSKFINVISASPPIMGHKCPPPVTSQDNMSEFGYAGYGYGESNEWLFLGECKRLCLDKEISTPHNNRICVNNSIPVYVEMRCREVPRDHRDCTLLSMYINVYYFHDDEMTAKMHSIQLDAVQSAPLNVIYTTIPESRYFIMAWPQENILGKIRSGLCKYSLTPQMDTLASIREFKSLRHELLYLECTGDDKLLGFGATQLTIWDHRSGDVLMNFDLEMKLGRNLGSVYYPGMETGQNSMIVLYQHIQRNTIENYYHELVIIGCTISHSQPTHRVLKRHKLPMPQFSRIHNAIVTAEHLVIVGHNDEEIWLSIGNPTALTCVPAQHTTRFYTRGRSQLVELTEKTLTVDSVANHVLKLAALGMGVNAATASPSHGNKC